MDSVICDPYLLRLQQQALGGPEFEAEMTVCLDLALNKNEGARKDQESKMDAHALR